MQILLKKSLKKRCKFTIGKKQTKNLIWERLGLHLGGVGGDFARDLEPLGASWAILGALFFVLVSRVVFKSALGGFWVAFWLDFEGFGRGLGRILGQI